MGLDVRVAAAFVSEAERGGAHRAGPEGTAQPDIARGELRSDSDRGRPRLHPAGHWNGVVDWITRDPVDGRWKTFGQDETGAGRSQTVKAVPSPSRLTKLIRPP
jgi:hypothetical protein